MSMEHFDDDDSKSSKKGKGGKKEFDCPDCNANNPTDEPIADGDELRCNYCGNEYKISFSETGRMKFKEL